jgi:hypothetical protein
MIPATGEKEDSEVSEARAMLASPEVKLENALLAIIPFDEKNNLPALIVDYQDRKQLAIDLILKTRPFP